MHATAVVPLPMKGSKTTPPLLRGVDNQVLHYIQRLDCWMPPLTLILNICGCHIILALCRRRAVERNTAFLDEHDILRVGHILTVTRWHGVGLVPSENVELVAVACGESEVLRYLKHRAEDIHVHTLAHPRHLLKALVANTAHHLVYLGAVVLFLYAKRATTATLSLEIWRVGYHEVNASAVHRRHTLHAVLILNRVYLHRHSQLSFL